MRGDTIVLLDDLFLAACLLCALAAVFLKQREGIVAMAFFGLFLGIVFIGLGATVIGLMQAGVYLSLAVVLFYASEALA